MTTDQIPKIKVLVIDDSAFVRKILCDAIDAESDMETVGVAPDPNIARDKIIGLKPDVLTLDIEMPRMNGLEFLKGLMQNHPVPTIIISSLGRANCAATLEALRYGAVDVLAKPAGPSSLASLRQSLPVRIRGAAASRPHMAREVASAISVRAKSCISADVGSAVPTVIALGASTGGTVAIQEILHRLPADMPPIVITQHMPRGFSAAFANRLNRVCAMEIREATDGETLSRGVALIAPGDFHLLIRQSHGGYVTELEHGPQVCYQRPSVDVMFSSVAQAAGKYGVGVLLTGMGTDGAKGLLALKRADAATIAQDESSCVVYGMPREATRLGAVGTSSALADIARLLVRTVKQQTSTGNTHPIRKEHT